MLGDGESVCCHDGSTKGWIENVQAIHKDSLNQEDQIFPLPSDLGYISYCIHASQHAPPFGSN